MHYARTITIWATDYQFDGEPRPAPGLFTDNYNMSYFTVLIHALQLPVQANHSRGIHLHPTDVQESLTFLVSEAGQKIVLGSAFAYRGGKTCKR